MPIESSIGINFRYEENKVKQIRKTNLQRFARVVAYDFGNFNSFEKYSGWNASLCIAC